VEEGQLQLEVGTGKAGAAKAELQRGGACFETRLRRSSG